MASKKTKSSNIALPSTSTENSNNLLVHYSTIVLSVIVLLLTTLSRVNLFDIPLSRDEGTYALLGKMAMQGKIPYVDFYEMKPPLLYYFLGIGGEILGYSETGLRVFLLLISLASCFFIFEILRKNTNIRMAFLGAATYSFLSLNLYAFGFAIVAEHIVNLMAILTAYFILSTSFKMKYFFAGFTMAIAIFTKQTAVLFLPVMLLLVYFQSGNIKKFSKDLLWFVLGGTAIGLFILIFFIATSSLNDAVFWMFEYPSKYADSISWSEGKDYFSMFFNKIISFQKLTLSILSLLVLASVLSIKNNLIKSFILYLMLAIVAIFPGYRFYGQYWLPVFPALTLLAMISLHYLSIKWNKLSILMVLVPLLAITDFSMHKDYYLANNKHAEVLSFYKGNPFDAIKKLSEYANKIMKPEEKFMMLGSEPQAYLYAEKDPDTKHIFMGMMSRQTEKQIPFTNEVLNDIEKIQPEYILYNLFAYSWMLKNDESSTLYGKSFKLVDNLYTPIAAYNAQEKKYYFENEKSKIDFYKAEQITLLKRK